MDLGKQIRHALFFLFGLEEGPLPVNKSGLGWVFIFCISLGWLGCGQGNGVSPGTQNRLLAERSNPLERMGTRSDEIGSSFVGEMEIQDFGIFSLNDKESGPLTLTVPDGASGFTLVADGTESDAHDVDISSLVAPDGSTWITKDYQDVDPIGRNNAQGYGGTTVALSLPHAVYSVPSGDYTFTIGNFFTRSFIQVYGIVNHRAFPTGGTLDVNLIFVSIPDYTGPDDPNVATMVNEFRRIYALQNIQLGAVNHYVLDRPDLTNISSVDNNSNGQNDGLDTLFRFSSITGNRAMNFFFVQSVGSGVLGKAGGIPGPPLIQGTAHSGVVIATFGDLSSQGKEFLILQGGTMAHEGAHYLGLFHPSESSGTIQDPIADTPECGPDRDSDHNGKVDVEECLDLTGYNLMFWGAPPDGSGIVQDELTEGQKYVLNRNPLIH